ncbi:hypothetical protein EBU95_08230 [bacterium]|nr:hypothetical protein [bacterium]
MKKLLPIILIGSGLLLLAGCACDEMTCEKKATPTASKKTGKATEKSPYTKEVVADKKTKAKKEPKKESKKHAYQDLSELAPWADFDREVVA